MSFGKRIRDLRRTRLLTQRDVVDRLKEIGLEADFTYISKIENDNLAHPPSEKLIRGLARVLGADEDELLDLAGKFSTSALQSIVTEIPEAGVLLRRLQSGQISGDIIKRWLNENEGQKPE